MPRAWIAQDRARRPTRFWLAGPPVWAKLNHPMGRAYYLLMQGSSHGLSSSDRGEPAQQSQIDRPNHTARPGQIIDERPEAWKSLPEAGAASRGIVCLRGSIAQVDGDRRRKE